MLLYKSPKPEGVRDDVFRLKQDVFHIYMKDKAEKDGWKPDWNQPEQEKWCMVFNPSTGRIQINCLKENHLGGNVVYFSDAAAAMEIYTEHYEKLLKYYFEIEIVEVDD